MNQKIKVVDGTKYWYTADKLHREDGPAVECANGTKCWYISGKRHREDGAAIERADGTKRWFLFDKEQTMTNEDLRWHILTAKIRKLNESKN